MKTENAKTNSYRVVVNLPGQDPIDVDALIASRLDDELATGTDREEAIETVTVDLRPAGPTVGEVRDGHWSAGVRNGSFLSKDGGPGSPGPTNPDPAPDADERRGGDVKGGRHLVVDVPMAATPTYPFPTKGGGDGFPTGGDDSYGRTTADGSDDGRVPPWVGPPKGAIPPMGGGDGRRPAWGGRQPSRPGPGDPRVYGWNDHGRSNSVYGWNAMPTYLPPMGAPGGRPDRPGWGDPRLYDTGEARPVDGPGGSPPSGGGGAGGGSWPPSMPVNLSRTRY